MLHYNSVIAQFAGAKNTAADFLSETEINPTEKLDMNVQIDVVTKEIEMNLQFTADS